MQRDGSLGASFELGDVVGNGVVDAVEVAAIEGDAGNCGRVGLAHRPGLDLGIRGGALPIAFEHELPVADHHQTVRLVLRGILGCELELAGIEPIGLGFTGLPMGRRKRSFGVATVVHTGVIATAGGAACRATRRRAVARGSARVGGARFLATRRLAIELLWAANRASPQ